MPFWLFVSRTYGSVYFATARMDAGVNRLAVFSAIPSSTAVTICALSLYPRKMLETPCSIELSQSWSSEAAAIALATSAPSATPSSLSACAAMVCATSAPMIIGLTAGKAKSTGISVPNTSKYMP